MQKFCEGTLLARERKSFVRERKYLCQRTQFFCEGTQSFSRECKSFVRQHNFFFPPTPYFFHPPRFFFFPQPCPFRGSVYLCFSQKTRFSVIFKREILTLVFTEQRSSLFNSKERERLLFVFIIIWCCIIWLLCYVSKGSNKYNL